eukprot:gene24919-30105_t
MRGENPVENPSSHVKRVTAFVSNNAIEHEIAGDLHDLPTEKVYPTYHAYWMHRWEISNVRKYYMGVDLTLDEADAVVNSLALVNALILTIPFGIIMGLSSDYWTTLRNDLVIRNTASSSDIYVIFKARTACHETFRVDTPSSALS